MKSRHIANIPNTNSAILATAHSSVEIAEKGVQKISIRERATSRTGYPVQ